MIEAGLIAHLLATTNVTALVGNRVYGKAAPQQEVFPRLHLLRVSTFRPRHTRGPCGLASARIEVNCLAETNAVAKDLANKVRKADGGTPGVSLEKFWGTMHGFTVRACKVDDERDMDEMDLLPFGGGERPVYGVALDVVIWFVEET